MRAVSSSSVTYPTANSLSSTVRRTVFFQGADVAVITEKAQAFMAALEAENPNEWAVVFCHLAGGSDGHVFVLMLECGRTGQQPAVQGMTPIAEARVPGYLAGQAAALDAADTRARVVATTGVQEMELQQILLGGSSQGTRFAGMYVGVVESPQ